VNRGGGVVDQSSPTSDAMNRGASAATTMNVNSVSAVDERRGARLDRIRKNLCVMVVLGGGGGSMSGRYPETGALGCPRTRETYRPLPSPLVDAPAIPGGRVARADLL
jgi:hypothetical protein